MMVAVVAIAALAMQYRINLANKWQHRVALPPSVVHGKGDNVMVFAPHSDDETLGCGGMLATSAANGAKVRVVLVTNGDGFRLAVSRAYKRLKVTPKECIEFAYRRQRETLHALSKLGVAPKSVTFLGYPDRGIEPLWNGYWTSDRLYRSCATKADRSPYHNSYTPRAPYCGESLLRDVDKIIRETEPTDIYLPHPWDNHPDHYATYCFVAAAVEQLREEGYSKPVRLHTYLVHRGDWPTPKGNHPDDPLAPPYALAKSVTRWSSLALSPEVTYLKRSAIREYKTQTAMERGFLLSFARRNEIFGDVPVRRVGKVQPGSIAIDGNTADWPNVPPAIVDPVGDYVVAGLYRGGDVRTVYMASDGVNLYVRIDCVRRLSSRVTYSINFRGLDDGGDSNRCSIAIRTKKRGLPEGVMWGARNNTLEIAVPLSRLQSDRDIFLQVQTKVAKVTVDKTGWQNVETLPLQSDEEARVTGGSTPTAGDSLAHVPQRERPDAAAKKLPIRPRI